MTKKKPGPRKRYKEDRETTIIKLTESGRKAILEEFDTIQAAINWLEEYMKRKNKKRLDD